MKKYLIIFFFLFFQNNLYSEEKIVYLDVSFLLSQSEAGKYINRELKKINDSNTKEFKDIETSIKNKEENLLKQKNILKEEEFNNKVNILREEYKSYQKIKSKKNNELKKLRDDSGNQILIIINEILAKYSTENKISLILEKKNIVIGKTNLDITKNILELLNEKIKKVELK